MKNFRVSYYEKVGFPSVDVRKCLENCFTTTDDTRVDKAKVSQVVLKYDLPDEFRLTVWKLLLGVDSYDQNAVDFVRRQRRETFQILLRGLRTMRRVDRSSTTFSTPNCAEMSLMLRLERNQLDSAVPDELSNEQESSINSNYRDNDFQSIYNVVTLVDVDPVDCFWLCRNIELLCEQKRPMIAHMIHETQNRLSQINSSLSEHLTSIGFWASQALTSIYRSMLSVLLHGDTLLRVWDKIIAGSIAVEVFVLIECLLETEVCLRLCIDCTRTDEILAKLKQSLTSIQATVIDKALTDWSHNGCLLSFKITDDDGGHRRSSFSFKKATVPKNNE